MTAWDLLDFYGRLFRHSGAGAQRRMRSRLEKVRLQPEPGGAISAATPKECASAPVSRRR